VNSANDTVTRDAATIFLTPGVRVKFLPNRAASPYVAAGGGWAVYEQSTNTLSGAPNPAPRVTHHGAFNFGAGVDVRVWKLIGLRAEVRDFYAGAPSYNTTAIRGGQHNVVAGGGFVLRFK
jgi:opacity protein-like surface antigen